MTKMRYIKASTIKLGDVIRVSTEWEDTKSTVIGVVAKRITSGRSTFYETERGHELLATHPDGTVTRGEARVTKITLIDRNPDLTLF